MGWGCVLVFLCPLSVSKAHAIRRNNIFIHLRDFFLLCMGFTEMKKIILVLFYLGGIMCHKTDGQVCDPTCSKYIKIVIYPPETVYKPCHVVMYSAICC